MSIYGYGFEGEGYRYPRRARKAVIADPKAWARAAIYNKGVVAANPWVQHLRRKGVYKQIREILREAAKDYHPKDPEKRKTNLERALAKLEDEYVTISKDYPKLREGYKYNKTLPYDAARKRIFDQLRKRATYIMAVTGKQSNIPPLKPQEAALLEKEEEELM
jgi:hypothetical protein